MHTAIMESESVGAQENMETVSDQEEASKSKVTSPREDDDILMDSDDDQAAGDR